MTQNALASYTLAELLKDFSEKNINPNTALYNYLSVTDVGRLRVARKKLQRIRDRQIKARGTKGKARRGLQARLIGRRFEQLVQILLEGCKALKHHNNIRTTTSEIDFRLRVEPCGTTIPMFKLAGTHALGEAKCVTSGVKTEWINELAGMLITHDASLAILFTACPSKPLRTEHRQAIALQAAKGLRVVPFGLKQVGQIEDGENFLELLYAQYVSAMTHGAELAI